MYSLQQWGWMKSHINKRKKRNLMIQYAQCLLFLRSCLIRETKKWFVSHWKTDGLSCFLTNKHKRVVYLIKGFDKNVSHWLNRLLIILPWERAKSVFYEKEALLCRVSPLVIERQTGFIPATCITFKYWSISSGVFVAFFA